MNTNDYYFSVNLDETRTVALDILTGNLYRIENDGSKKQRLVRSDSIRNNQNAEPVVPASTSPVYTP
jgi:hypothetical protein